MESIDKPSHLHTIAAIPLAFITWVIVYTLAHIALYLLDSTRGLADDWLQGIFRELFTPGIGGYAAIYCVDKYLPKSNLNLVAVFYCLPIVGLYLFFSLYMIIYHGRQYDFIWKDQMLGWGLAVATCIGTYIAVKNLNS